MKLKKLNDNLKSNKNSIFDKKLVPLGFHGMIVIL